MRYHAPQVVLRSLQTPQRGLWSLNQRLRSSKGVGIQSYPLCALEYTLTFSNF